MSGFHDYLTTPAGNTSLGGVSVAEGCPPGNLNNAIRQLMADGKALADEVSGIVPGMPPSGGTFTGDIVRSGRGGYLNHASSALPDGRVYVLPEGAALPAGGEGMLVFFYT